MFSDINCDVDHMQEFMSITGLNHDEAIIYVNQGKGNLGLALNYFYNKQDRKSGKQKVSVVRDKPIKPDAFAELKQGSERQLQLARLVRNLQDEYAKPIEEQLKMNKIVSSPGEQQLSYFPDMLEKEHHIKIVPHQISARKASRQFMVEEQSSLGEFTVQFSDHSHSNKSNKQTQIQMSDSNQMKEEVKVIQNETKCSEKVVCTQMKEEYYEVSTKMKEEDQSIQFQIRQEQVRQREMKVEQEGAKIQMQGQANIKSNLQSMNQEQPILQNLVGKKLDINTSQKTKKLTVQFPLMLGKCMINAQSLKSQNLSQILKGTELRIKIEDFAQNNIKKGRKNAKQQEGLIVRLLYQDEEIGRFNQKQEEIFGPLLKRNYITIKVFYNYSQKMCKIFDPIQISIEVYLLEQALSEPDEQLDNGDQDQQSKVFLETKGSFQNLLQLLKLELRQETLIKFLNSSQQKSKDQVIERPYFEEPNEIENTNNNINKQDPYQRQPTQMKLPFIQSKVSDFPKHIVEKQVELQNSQQTETDNLDYEQLFKLQQYDDLKLYEPSPSFTSKLYDYQKQALYWMLSREGFLESNMEENNRVLHPLWQEYDLKIHGLLLYFSPFSGQLSLNIPKSSQKCKGGILADEMGLGKTIMFLSLIHTNNTKLEKRREPIPDILAKRNKKENSLTNYMKASSERQAKNLIIVPLTLIAQWEQEALTHSKKGSLSVFIYYGIDRELDNLDKFDIVITTYGVVSNEYNRKNQNKNKGQSMFDFNWFRIILDEAHYIKGRTILVAQAIYNLKGQYRWCSTGTPVQNKLDDMFALIHFIKLEPWSDYLWWNTHINKEFDKGGESSTLVQEMLRVILNPIILRRTKKSKKKDGSYIITLPPKNLLLHHIEFNEEELDIYQRMERKSKDELEGYIAKGLLLSKYMQFLEIILRLRQICDHQFLILTRSNIKNIDQLEVTLNKFLVSRRTKGIKTEEDETHYEIVMNERNEEIKFAMRDKQNVPDKLLDLEQIKKYQDDLIVKIKNNDIGDCAVCFDKIEDAVVTSCLHLLCRLCMKGVLANQHCCPQCRQYLSKEDIMTLPRDREYTFDWKMNYKRSSKIQAIISIVKERVLTTPNDKCVIFTQFIGMIDFVEFDMEREGIKIIRMDGKLNQVQRTAVIKKFNEDPKTRIFMVSLKTGGVGLNLVAANHVILVDPWWNPAVEDQAIERIYRIGQKKEVFVHRLTIKDSIEERIIQMHKEKKLLFENTVTSSEDRKLTRLQQFKHLLLL